MRYPPGGANAGHHLWTELNPGHGWGSRLRAQGLAASMLIGPRRQHLRRPRMVPIRGGQTAAANSDPSPASFVQADMLLR